MKKFNWLMMLLATVALSFVACEEPQPEPKPTPDGLSFEVAVGEVTHSSVDFTITPSDVEADYLCVLYDVETADEYTKDEYLIAALYQELETEARSKGQTLAEYMPSIVDRGVLETGYTGLASETEYYIIVFGVDAAKDYRASTDAHKTKITTLEAPSLDVTFEVTTTVDGNDATFEIVPSDNEAIWYFYTVPSAAYQAYTDPAGDYRMDDDRFILYCVQQQINEFRNAGYADNDILNALFHKGTLTLQAKGLNANTEYTNVIAGFIISDAGEISLATAVDITTYTTGEPKAKELTFEISVTDIEMIRAAIKVTPSDLKETFCWMIGEWDEVQTAEEIMNEIVAMYGGWMNNGAMLYTGVQDYTGGPGSAFKYKLDSPDTNYYVIAFGYAGGITTEPEMVTFRTLPAPDPNTTEFQMSASNVTPYSFTISVVPNHSTTYYSFNVCLADEYDEELIITSENEAFDYMLEMSQQFNPDTTVAQVLSSYYYRDAYTADASGLMPETEYMGYVVVYNPEDGHVLKVIKFDSIATTKSVGSITPAVELVGYYSGDEENGSVFGNASATAGQAITVVKYTNFDGARSLFSTMLGGNLTNPVAEGCSDAALWGTAAAYWNSVKTAQPYSFYVAEWDYEQTALAYAVDQSGLPGGIGRLYTMPTAENKGDIAELKTLVDQLNAETRALALPESLVVGDAMGMVLSNVAPVNSEVEFVAPAAEVKAAEPVCNAAQTFVGGGYIRPFYL